MTPRTSRSKIRIVFFISLVAIKIHIVDIRISWDTSCFRFDALICSLIAATPVHTYAYWAFFFVWWEMNWGFSISPVETNIVQIKSLEEIRSGVRITWNYTCRYCTVRQRVRSRDVLEWILRTETRDTFIRKIDRFALWSTSIHKPAEARVAIYQWYFPPTNKLYYCSLALFPQHSIV